MVQRDVRYAPPEWIQVTEQICAGQPLLPIDLKYANRWPLGIIALEVMFGAETFPNNLMTTLLFKAYENPTLGKSDVSALLDPWLSSFSLSKAYQKFTHKLYGMLAANPSKREFV